VCHQQTGKYECKQTQVCPRLCMRAYLCAGSSECLCVCAFVLNQILIAHTCPSANICNARSPPPLTRSSSLIRQRNWPKCFSDKEFKANTHTQTHPHSLTHTRTVQTNIMSQQANKQSNKQTAKKIQLVYSPTNKKEH